MRALAVALFVLWGMAACNTDPVWEPRQKAEGPTTSLSNPEGVDVPDIQIADSREVDLVEQVLEYRALYHQSLKALQEFYRRGGDHTKGVWVASELADVERIKPFRYILAAEIPPEKLTPRDQIAEADALYERGLALLDEGGRRTPLLYRESKMRQSLAAFRELIEKYPSSDKIDDAAFFCGEIHKEYFKGEEPIAVKWYERAFTWDPETPHPARFQAAVIYDYRLHDRDRALELYQQVIQVETGDRTNVNFSVRRIGELTEDPTARRASAPNTPATLGAPTTYTPTGDER